MYRIRTITKKAYRTSLLYFFVKIKAYGTVPTYRTLLPSLDSSDEYQEPKDNNDSSEDKAQIAITAGNAMYYNQSCKSGRAFRVGFGLKVDKNFGLNSGLRRTYCLRCTKI